ncbi:MAG: kinase [Chloroflexi bacterium RBG_13_46_14]|nr:MAG: kinase [Chloroflexi bacterium RBG_13_46_14]
MIISRTPLRISFFGGGTDYPVFYEEHGGAVLSTSINKYSYVICRRLPPFFDYNYRIRYAIQEEIKTIAEIKHPSARECLNFMKFDYGIEIHHNADLPAMSGLGSSSAFTVGLLNVLHALKGQLVTKRELALEAIHVEQDMIKENVGSQDQTAAAFGGFNRIEFGGRRKIWVQPITLEQSKMGFLQNHLMLFFTGFPRNASEIAAEQIRTTPQKTAELEAMKEMVDEAVKVLNSHQNNYDDFGRLLHETWQLKRGLTPQITNSHIDEIYEMARGAGALGGKLLGAGGGGFILLFVRPESQPKIREKLGKLLYVPFNFHDLGSQIVYYAPEQNY